MKVTQQLLEFKPISITLETPEEVEMILDALEKIYPNYPMHSKTRNFLIEIANELGRTNF